MLQSSPACISRCRTSTLTPGLYPQRQNIRTNYCTVLRSAVLPWNPSEMLRTTCNFNSMAPLLVWVLRTAVAPFCTMRSSPESPCPGSAHHPTTPASQWSRAVALVNTPFVSSAKRSSIDFSNHVVGDDSEKGTLLSAFMTRNLQRGELQHAALRWVQLRACMHARVCRGGKGGTGGAPVT